MRSSIACIRCRRSKVKCINSGVGTTCRSCDNSGRECLYPSPLPTGSRRRESLPGRADGYGETPKRARKSANALSTASQLGQHESPRPQLDALDSGLLTPQVWQELFDIFQLHYSADLPFLHPPTFLKPLRFATLQPPSASTLGPDTSSPARPPGSTEFLLAFLALTVRYHPKIVAHHSPPTSTRLSNPLIASEYYAMAANERMANFWTDNRAQDIERTQAALMLGLHEWGMCRGSKAWLIVGMAIRSAQAMGLQYEYDLDDAPMSRSVALNAEAERMGVDANGKGHFVDPTFSEDVFIQQEIRRRTFWSCFIMDRYLSSGKYRPQMLHAHELRIQLPASERSFLFAEKVRTLMLGEEDRISPCRGRAEVQSQREQSVRLATGGPPELSSKHLAMPDGEDDKGRWETSSDEGLVSRYIKILELYGKVVKWTCAGGRRIEEHPPWDPRSEFAKLRQQCLDFKTGLPRQHALTPQNTQAHISLKTSTPYTLVHAVYLLCQIMLHREYVPFMPLRCSKPEGPLDPPIFPPERYDIPAGFWLNGARECFKAARDIIDLVRTCQEWNALVETPIIGFAVYKVAFVGVYCINFPWMDPEGYMCTPRKQDSDAAPGSSRPGESKGFEAARKALEMIGNMRPRMHMADGWFKTINRMHKYFRRIKSDYRKNTAAMEGESEGGSPLSTRQLTLREGGQGGGLDEFKLLERTLQDFGNLEDQDVEMSDVHQSSRPLDAVYDDSSAGTTVKSEEGDRRTGPGAEPPRPEGAWSAINTAPTAAPSRYESVSGPSSGQFRSYDTHHGSESAQLPPLQQSQLNHAHHLNNFRPALHDGGAAPSASPSHTSPASHSAVTPSHTSPSTLPPLQQARPTSTYNGWTPQNAGYQQPQQQMQPPPALYTNGVSHSHHQQQSSSVAAVPAQLPIASPLPPHQKPWNLVEREAWLKSLDTMLGGDDIAAFVDGGEFADWAHMAASQGFANGWLTTVWGGGV